MYFSTFFMKVIEFNNNISFGEAGSLEKLIQKFTCNMNTHQLFSLVYLNSKRIIPLNICKNAITKMR